MTYEGWSNAGKLRLMLSLARRIIELAPTMEDIPESLLLMQSRVVAGLEAVASVEDGRMK